MRWATIKMFGRELYCDLCCNHTFAMAAALSYYFLLSLFPLLIFLAATLAYLPIPNLFDEILKLMSRFVPAQAMGVVQGIVTAVMFPPRTGLLSFGVLATVWAATGGFNAMIEALNMAYKVTESRPFWHTRGLSFLMTFLIGTLVTVGLSVTLLGPRFGEILQGHLHVGPLFAMVWPALRWAVILVTMILSVEVLYFVAPNVKQSFLTTLPGAVIGVSTWIAASLVFGIYVRDYSHYNATYGTLGGVVALMLWFYVSAVALLLGAEVNAGLMRARGRVLPMKAPAPAPAEKAA